MALAYLDSDFIQGLGDNTATRTGSCDVNASADFILVVVMWGHTGVSPAINSVTYDGDTCTSVGAEIEDQINFVFASTQIFSLNNPSTGTNTVTVNFASATNTSTVYVLGFSGTDLASPVYGYDATTGNGTAIDAVPSATTVSGDIAVGICASGQSTVSNLSTSDTEIAEIDYTALTNIVAGIAYEEVSGSGAEVNWTAVTTGQDFLWTVVVVKADGGGGGASLIAQYKSEFRGVFSRINGRVN